MKNTSAYYELTNLQGLYSNYLSLGQFSQIPQLLTEDASMEIYGESIKGKNSIKEYFMNQENDAKEKGLQEFFSVFGQLSEINEDATEARCLWMFASIIYDRINGTATHRVGRIDEICVKKDGLFKIKKYKQFIRTQLEPVAFENAPQYDLSLVAPKLSSQKCFCEMEEDSDVAEELDIINTHSRYEQYLHCGNWNMVSTIFSDRDDSSWTVGGTRKAFLANNPDYNKEPDGPAYSEEPPYWMGAVTGHDNVINNGFGGMTKIFSKENAGLYCCSDMLLTIAVIDKTSGKAYTSAPSYGGFILGPAFTNIVPYPTASAIGRWSIEWVKEDGVWKMHHFFWSTFYEIIIDRYDPRHQIDWLSQHDIHDWPALPMSYEQ